MKLPSSFLLLCMLLLAACSNTAPNPPRLVGADRDAHGCIPSAGYRWCARTHQCERPWELAKQQAFDSTPAAFDAFCAAPASGR